MSDTFAVKYAIVCIGFADGRPTEDAGRWLKSYDPEFRGLGLAVWTNYIDDAMKFDSAPDAFAFWRQQSKKTPLRPDGKPNRPLTAYTVNIAKVVAS